ncbi:hypothetical protein HBN90_14070 [Pseudomonas chengduensis]|nr:hypothetical protein [Pseudomonas chengduensis]NNB75265.1 hypothetical protein [Pseudomonas chengduensis]
MSSPRWPRDGQRPTRIQSYTRGSKTRYASMAGNAEHAQNDARAPLCRTANAGPWLSGLVRLSRLLLALWSVLAVPIPQQRCAAIYARTS